jgi:hypothetical protein
VLSRFGCEFTMVRPWRMGAFLLLLSDILGQARAQSQVGVSLFSDGGTLAAPLYQNVLFSYVHAHILPFHLHRNHLYLSLSSTHQSLVFVCVFVCVCVCVCSYKFVAPSVSIVYDAIGSGASKSSCAAPCECPCCGHTDCADTVLLCPNQLL